MSLDLTLSVERLFAHPALREDVKKVALRWGPLVYCLEGSDHPVPLYRIAIPHDASFEQTYRADLLAGVNVLTGVGMVLETADWGLKLYRTSPLWLPRSLTAIPYFAWDQRESGEMLVWIHSWGGEP